MYDVYVLKNLKTDRFYIGYTIDLDRRINEHNKNKEVELIYYKCYKNANIARKRELGIKQYGSAWRAIKKRMES